MSYYTRMVIGETRSINGVKALSNLIDAHVADIRPHPDFVSLRLLEEDGGKLVILEVTFASKEACLLYPQSYPYRKFVMASQHLLVWDFVVKWFRQIQTNKENQLGG